MSSQPHYPPPTGPPPGYGRRRFPLAAVAAAVAVLIVVAAVGFWLGGRDGKGTSAAGTTSPAASVAPTAAVAATGAAPSATIAAPSATAGPPSALASASAGVASARASSAPVTSSVPATTSASPSPAPGTSPPVNPVPDFGYLHSVVTAGGVTKLTFDRAILLTGPAAASYAKAHHTEVLDDYMIQNDNPLIRTWTVSPNVVVTGSIQLSGKVQSTPSTVAALEAFIPAHTKSFLPVNLYYDKNDTVTKIAEQYFP